MHSQEGDASRAEATIQEPQEHGPTPGASKTSLAPPSTHGSKDVLVTVEQPKADDLPKPHLSNPEPEPKPKNYESCGGEGWLPFNTIAELVSK